MRSIPTMPRLALPRLALAVLVLLGAASLAVAGKRPSVKTLKDGTVEVRRDVIDALFSTPGAFAKQARFVPSFADGKPLGMKLFAIRVGSLVASVGFLNGDTVHAVNGLPLTSADEALAAYAQLKTETRFVFDVTRRGKPKQLVMVIVEKD